MSAIPRATEEEITRELAMDADLRINTRKAAYEQAETIPNKSTAVDWYGAVFERFKNEY